MVLALCEWRDLTSTEIGRYLEKSPQYVRERYVSKFLEKGLLDLTEHPSSKNVRYKISKDGREWLERSLSHLSQPPYKENDDAGEKK